MSKKTVYLIIKVDIQIDSEMSDSVLQEIVSELDYDITSDCANITNTEIVGASEQVPLGT